MIKKITISNIFLVIISVLYFFQIFYNIWNSMGIEEMSIGGTGKVPLIMVLIIAFGGIYCLITKNIKISSSFHNFLLIWTIGTIVNAWFVSTDILNSRIMQTLQSISTYILFIFFNKAGLQYQKNNAFFDRIVIVLIIALLVTYIQTYNIIHSYFYGNDYIAAPSYFLLMLLPIAFCIKQKTWRWIYVVTIIICQLSSIKRGGTIALFLFLIAYYIVQSLYVVHNKHFFRTLFILIVLFPLAYYGFVVFDKTINDGMLVNRLEMMGKGDTSTRGEIYEDVWNGIKKSTATELIFGHGINTVQKITHIEVTAHNDFLEVLYDYGLIMFGVYLWFYVLFFRFIKRLIRSRSSMAAPVAACFSIFLVLSMVSQLLTVVHFATLMMFLGYAKGRAKKEQQIQQISSNL